MSKGASLHHRLFTDWVLEALPSTYARAQRVLQPVRPGQQEPRPVAGACNAVNIAEIDGMRDRALHSRSAGPGS